MEEKIFIPELHDIGKLIDKKVRNLIGIKDHPLIDSIFDQHGNKELFFPSWWTQYHHKKKDKNKPNDWGTENDIKDWKDIPKEFRQDLFILILSDHLAASSSRSTLEKFGFTPDDKQPDNPEQQKSILKELGIDNQDEIRGIVKLWNKKFYQDEESRGNSWAKYDKAEDIQSIFNEIQRCQSGKEFLEINKKYLKLTPEDKTLPRNITSLYTHLELVGNIYRVLKRCTHFEKNDEDYFLRLNNQRGVKSIGEAEGGKQTTPGKGGKDKGKWQARLIKCHIGFYQSLVRIHDINVFKKREMLIQNMLSRFEHSILFYTSDFIVLFLAGYEDLHEIFQEFTDSGFYVKCVETTADLGILRSNLDNKVLKARVDKDEQRIKVLRDRETKVKMKIIAYNPEPVLKSNICEVCQNYESIISPWIHENVEEWLCQTCWNIRELHIPFREYYEDWKGERVCWFKFTLDQDKLENWLQKSFADYVGKIGKHYNLNGKDILISEFRLLAPQVDFNNDYKEMLEEFWEELIGEIKIKKPIEEYNELGVFLYSAELTIRIIQKYLSLIGKYFPDCALDEESPIGLSLSFANIKYPVREHWRFFENDKNNFLNVHNQNIYKGSYSMNEIQQILNVVEKSVSSPVSKSALHDIIQAFEKLNSEIELTLRLKDKSKDVYKLYVNEGIMPERFLQMYKILGGGE